MTEFSGLSGGRKPEAKRPMDGLERVQETQSSPCANINVEHSQMHRAKYLPKYTTIQGKREGKKIIM